MKNFKFRKLLMALFSYISLLCSSFVFAAAGGSHGGGGDSYVLDFKMTAYEDVYPWLQRHGQKLTPAVDAEAFKRAVDTLVAEKKISSQKKVHETCLKSEADQTEATAGREVEMCYNENTGEILISRNLYVRADRSNSKRASIAHEIFRVMKLEGDSYQLSMQMLAIMNSGDSLSQPVGYTLQAPANELTCTMTQPLTVQGAYTDPNYARYLVPGNINYDEIFSKYNSREARSTRDHNFSRFMAKVRALPMDRHGIINLSMVVPGDASVAASLYIEALRQAYSPITGIRVAEAKIQLQAPSPGGWSNRGGMLTYRPPDEGYTLMNLFVIVDAQAEEKIELMKIEAMITIEEAAAQLRRKILDLHKEGHKNLRELEILRLVFGAAPTVSEIRAILKDVFTSGNYESLHLSINSKEINRILSNRESISAARRLLQNVNDCLVESPNRSSLGLQQLYEKLGKTLSGVQ